MAAPKKEVLLQRKIEVLEKTLAENDAAHLVVVEAGETQLSEAQKITQQMKERGDKYGAELDETKRENNRLKADLDIANQRNNEFERLNGIQAGYVQRINEDEAMRENRMYTRAGPVLDNCSYLSHFNKSRY